MKTRRLLILFSFLLFIAALLLLPGGIASRLQSIGEFFSNPIESVTAIGLRLGRETVGGLPPDMTIEQRDALIEENARLKIELTQLKSKYTSLDSTNEELLELLRFSKDRHDYTLIPCQVVKRNPLCSYQGVLTIDKGIADGLQTGLAVISLHGFVGTISNITPHTAEITLIGHANFSLPCQIENKGITGLLTCPAGESNLDFTAPLKKLDITSPSGLMFDTAKVGDKVFTTDLGSDQMQSGLLIGTISGVSTDFSGGAPHYSVTPAADIGQLSMLLVVAPMDKRL